MNCSFSSAHRSRGYAERARDDRAAARDSPARHAGRAAWRGDVLRAGDAEGPRRAARGASRRAAARRRHRRRAVGHEAAQRSADDHLHRRRRRTEGDPRDRSRPRDRRRGATSPTRTSARRAPSGARRALPALRVAADPQRRHARRQHRQRLADRRLDAGADRARRDARAAQGQAARAKCRSRLSISPTRRRRSRRASSSSASACRIAPPGAHLRTYKISKRFDQDISAVCGAFRCRARSRSRRRGADRVRRHGGDAEARAGRASTRSSGATGAKPTVRAAMAALGDDYAPITDMRASGGYRKSVARNLLYVLARDVGPHDGDAGRRIRRLTQGNAHGQASRRRRRRAAFPTTARTCTSAARRSTPTTSRKCAGRCTRRSA